MSSPPARRRAPAAPCPRARRPAGPHLWSSVRIPPGLLGALLLGPLSACGGGSSGGGAEADCGALAGLERDLCLGRQLKALPAEQVDAVAPLATSISDGMVREEAVTTWIGKNSNKIPMDKGQAVCGLLTGREHTHCLRALTAPHLQGR